MTRQFIVFLFVFSLTGFSQAWAFERLEQTGVYLGTDVNAALCYPSGEKDAAAEAMAAVWMKFADIHAHMNLFDPASDVAAVNASAGGGLVKVHDDVYQLLLRSKDHARRTRGAFDVTVGPLMSLWKRAAVDGRIPGVDDIRLAKENIGAERIVLAQGGYVGISAGMKIDLGGNAAGFAADEAARIFRSAGFDSFLIDAGGEVYASGEACEGRPWHLGVNDPEGFGPIADILELKDSAVSTSGSYEKFFLINGERWGHIVNPITGYPRKDVVSATVVAPYALDADILSTALCVLGPVHGLRLIDSLGAGYAAKVIFSSDGIHLEQKETSSYSSFKMTGSMP